MDAYWLPSNARSYSPMTIASQPPHASASWATGFQGKYSGQRGGTPCCGYRLRQAERTMRAGVRVMGSGAGTGKIAVQRGELATREMDVMAALINRQYVEHKAWFRCPAPSRID